MQNPKAHKYFFDQQEKNIQITSDDYKQAEMAIKTADAITRSFNMGVYVIDYFRQDVLYMSKNLSEWCGLSEQDKEENNLDCYLNNIPENDLEMLKEINHAATSFWKHLPNNECLKYTVSYDFRLNALKTCFMVNQHYSPIAIKNNYIWLALCMVSISSKKEAGNIIMQASDTADYFEYSLQKHIWISQKGVSLTERDKEIIRLSAQGYTIAQTANIICLSEETIRSYRKALLKKLNVDSMVEAVRFCMNRGYL